STAPDGTSRHMTYDGLGRPTSQAAGDAPAHIYYRYDWAAPRPATETFTFDGEAAALGALPESWTPDSRWRHTVTVAHGAGEQILPAAQLDTDRWEVNESRARDQRGRVIPLSGPFSVEAGDPPAATPAADTPTQTLIYDPLDRVIDTVL